MGLKPLALLSGRYQVERLEPRHLMADVSAPVILQYFEGSWNTIEQRAADIHAAGYGSLYVPPPGRADSGGFSVGYDVYDRFDLGKPGNPTLYGTETGLKQTIDVIQRAGGNVYVDFVYNHNGFSDLSTPGFAASGGYPGFVVTLPNDIDADFHSSFQSGDLNGRLSGLIDIDQDKNYQYIRSPVPGFANNIPAGTTPAFGRLANIPSESNRALYPDQSLSPISVFDPTTNESGIQIHPFNLGNPSAGDPVSENSTGLLMRYAQWLIQVVGADGLRFDAAKHAPTWVLNYIDRAVYRSSFRANLDGSQQQVFSFGEVFSGDKGQLQQFIRKDINPNDPGRVGGNRDVFDFPLHFAQKANLTNNGLANDWRNIVNASQDVNDDGFGNNGSQGVSFVSSHDEFGPDLGNVAYAYNLLRPGNAVVYFNGREFGSNRDFPKDGRGDALGGQFGDTITKLVDIRNRYGRGDYISRLVEKEVMAYERNQSAVVLLSNRTDGGFDSRTIQTSFPGGTQLIELTGNAANSTVDPFNDIPSYVVVNGDGTINIRIPRNTSANGTQHGLGYLIYGPATPTGTLTLTGVQTTLAPQTATPSTNGTARVSPIDVITGNSFTVSLATNQANLLGTFRDQPADGDNALFKFNGGLNLNGNSAVDYVTPGSVGYGFEEFRTTRQPGFTATNGDGSYSQTISTAALGEGMHFLTVRAFRQRNPGAGEALFTDFRRSIYVDQLPAVSAIESFDPIVSGVNENRRVTVRSIDKTADNVHVLLDLPAGLTDAEVLSRIGSSTQTNRTDRDLFTIDLNGLSHGNHVLTVVSFEISGRASIQRFPGRFTSTIFGAGLGDVELNGNFNDADALAFVPILESNQQQFNPAADANGDGLVDTTDLLLLRAQQPTYGRIIDVDRTKLSGVVGQAIALGAFQPTGGLPAINISWDVNNDGAFGDASGTSPQVSWTQALALGIRNSGNYPVVARFSNGSQILNVNVTLNLGAANASLAGQFIYYAGSTFDNGTASAAIDSSKQSLSTGLSSPVNFSNYSRGLNGIVVDIAGLPGSTLVANDFQFRTGRTNTPASWAILTVAPSAIALFRDQGTSGSSRVKIRLPDNAVSNTWLSVTVLPTSNTGLTSSRTFIFGSAIGEIDNAGPNYRITAADISAVRMAANGSAGPITRSTDVNKDGRVNYEDFAFVKNHAPRVNGLRQINVPANRPSRLPTTANSNSLDVSAPLVQPPFQVDSEKSRASAIAAVLEEFNRTKKSSGMN